MPPILAKFLSSRLVHDHGRLLMFAAVITLLAALEMWLPTVSGKAELAPALTAWWMVLGGVALALIARRLLAPRLDLQVIAAKAAEDSRGAGSVVLGLCILMAVVIICPVLMLR